MIMARRQQRRQDLTQHPACFPEKPQVAGCLVAACCVFPTSLVDNPQQAYGPGAARHVRPRPTSAEALQRLSVSLRDVHRHSLAMEAAWGLTDGLYGGHLGQARFTGGVARWRGALRDKA